MHFPEFLTNQIAFEKKNKIRHKQTSLVKEDSSWEKNCETSDS